MKEVKESFPIAKHCYNDLGVAWTKDTEWHLENKTDD